MKCPNCKNEIFDGQYQCHHCGAWIPAIKDKDEKAKKPTKKPKVKEK